MKEPPDHWAQDATSEAAIREQLIDLLSHRYDEALLPSLDDGLPAEQRTPCRYARILRREGVRLHVFNAWQDSRLWIRWDEAKIRWTAAELTRFICKQYLPGWRAQLADQVAELKAELDEILSLTQLPDALLIEDDQERVNRGTYSALILMKTIWPRVLAAREAMKPEDRRRIEKRSRVANKILREIMSDNRDLLDGSAVDRFTTTSCDRRFMQAWRQDFEQKLLGAATVPVKALFNCKAEDGTHPAGAIFEVSAANFLQECHQYALAFGTGYGPVHGPVFEANGGRPEAQKAHTCWRILKLLGEKMRSQREQKVPVFASLNDLAVASNVPKGGKRYGQIRTLTQGLQKLGMVRMRKVGRGYKITLTRSRVKYLRGLPRRWEELQVISTS